MSDGSTNIGSNVAGIGSLLNSLKIDNSVSLDDAEKCIMREFSMIKFDGDGDSNNGDVDDEEEIDPVAEFEKTLADIDGDDEDASDDDEEEEEASDEEDASDDEEDEDEAVDLTQSRGRDYASSGGRDPRDPRDR